MLFSAGGLFFLGLAALTALRRWNLISRIWKRFWLDTRRSFSLLRLQKRDLGFLAGVLALIFLAVVFRMERANSPMAHDEAYTYVTFSRSLFTAMTDYSKPNNHILHSILVYFSTMIFGKGAWVVRLPAFLAGVVLVPASYWLASRFYDRWTALGTAFLVAWFPPLVAYSNDARGYTMVALFTLLTLALGDHVRKDKNLFYWALISLFSALGLYTIPTMLYPFGVLFVWLFLENQVSGPGPYRTKKEFLMYWLAAGLGAAVLTALFYTPILIYTGAEKLFANDMLAPVPWKDLLVTVSARIQGTWVEWTTQVPIAVVIFLEIGWVLSLVFHFKIAQARIPLQLAALLWFSAIEFIQRANAEQRVWSFLMPLVLLWAAAGTFGLLQKVRLKFSLGIPLAAPLFGLILIYGFWHASWLLPQLPTLWAARGKQEVAVLFIQSQLQQDDMIVVSSPDDAPVWYYSDLHGLPITYFNNKNMSFKRALVLVDTQWQQTLPWVLEDRGPDPGQLNTASAQLIGKIGTIQVFEVPHE
ncbi:MAG: glycosyltransferase family 39 protein [Anaerolineales bacterium]